MRLSIVIGVLLALATHAAGQSNNSKQPPQSQVDALLAIKDAAAKHGGALGDWSKANAANVCRWAGVYCEGGDVRGVALAQRGKGPAPRGRLPPASALRALPRLWSFRAEGWGIRGHLPKGYGELTNLGELYLNVDGLGGGVPKEWGNLRSLKRLVLKSCNLTGELPPELGNLGSLEELNVTVNALTGQVPESLGRLSSLKVLDLSSNRFWGALPASWGALRGLQALDLSYNSDLHGPIPGAWKGLTSLKSLAAAECNIRGSLPNGLPQAWRAIEKLILAGNELTGGVPGGWAPSLQVLDLGHNQLTGPLPDKTGGTLTALYLGYNGLEGGVPASWGFHLKHVETLNLEQNKLSGPLPANVPAWSNRAPAVRLFLGGNRLSGPLPPEWKALNPAVLALRDNALTGRLPADYGFFWKATTNIDLARNKLTGPLPPAWANLPKLERLDVSRNHLSGQLPDAWASLLGRAKGVFVMRNKLEGGIPASWGAATAKSGEFYHFDARNNARLGGCLPRGMERFLFTANPFSSIFFDGTGVSGVCAS